MSFLTSMAVTLLERTLLVKLLYGKKGNAEASLWKFHLIKNLGKGPLLPQALKRIIARFKITGDLRVQPGRGCKPTRSDIVENVATAIVEQSMDVAGCNRARAVSQNLSIPYSTLQNILRKMVHFFPYKIRYNQQLLPINR